MIRQAKRTVDDSNTSFEDFKLNDDGAWSLFNCRD